MRFVLFALLAGCSAAGAVSGGFALDMQPKQPTFVGGFDFELGDVVKGHSCVTRSNPTLQAGPPAHYWFLGGGVEHISRDPIVVAVVGTAVLDAISENEDIDTIVVTHVKIDSKDEQTCADVWGRGVRLTKSMPPPVSSRKASQPDDSDDNDHDDDQEHSP